MRSARVGNGFIRAERARAAMQLVGEVHELGATTEAGRARMVSGLLDLVGCALGGAVHDTAYRVGLKHGISQATLVGFDRQILDVFQMHHVRGSDFNPFHRAVMDRRIELQNKLFTSHNIELVASEVWNRSEWINEYVRPAKVDHFIGSMRMLDDNVGMGVGFMRHTSDRPFSDEDREVMHLVHMGVGQLFDISSPRARLTPRMQQTLDELLTGATDKEIAQRLTLSVHTVRQYVKTILRVYGVANRAQLIAVSKKP